MKENIEEKEKIEKIQTEKNISEEEAKKDVAKTSVEEITGKSAETVSNEIREAMEVADALATGDIKKIKKEMEDTNLETLKKYQSDMKKYEGFADKAALGLGAGQLAILGNGAKVSKRIDEVVAEMENHGGKYDEKDENNPENEQNNLKNSQPDGRIIDNLEQAYEAGKNLPSNTLNTNTISTNITDELSRKFASKVAKEFVKSSFKGG